MTSAPANSVGGYNPEHFAQLDAVEDGHFWFQARRKVIGTLARQLTANLPPGYNALEVGCGNGSLLPTLQSACANGRVLGVDLFFQALSRARRRTTCPLIQASIDHPPFGVDFSLVGLFDVLEHMPDDTAALKSIYRVLAPGGALLLSVPAHMSLWSYFDVLSDHVRRYSPRQLRAVLESAGFQVEFQSQFLAILYPVMWLSRRLRKSGQQANPDAMSNELKVNPILNSILSFMLGSEAHLLARRMRLPIGTSLIAIARKPLA